MAKPLPKADRIAIASDLLKFTKYGFARNNRHFELNHHHVTMSETLMRVFRGEITRLIINIPPRYTKTELAVVNFMAWTLGLAPDCEFIHISYSKRLAANNAYNARALVKSEAYQEIFPDVKLMEDSKARDEWRTQQGGVVYATGSDGTITGYGAGKLRAGFGGAIIIDDPHKAAEAESATQRQNVIEFYKSTVESRCNSAHTPIIVIMQRLHHNDLVGWLLDGGSGDPWEILKMPAIDEQGNALWSFKHTIERLKLMQASNPYQFAGQYLQEPTPRDGGMIKSAWLEGTRYKTLPAEKIRIVQSWDTAYKAAQINDPSACTTWLQTANRYYLIESFVMRGEYPAVKRTMLSKYQQFQPDVVLIEDKASGQSLIQELRQTRITVIAIKPEGDKETRLNAVSTEFEAGKVWLPESASWLPAYEAELFAFPKAKHDDQVDSTSQALTWMRGSYNHAETEGYIAIERHARSSQQTSTTKPYHDDDNHYASRRL